MFCGEPSTKDDEKKESDVSTEHGALSVSPRRGVAVEDEGHRHAGAGARVHNTLAYTNGKERQREE